MLCPHCARAYQRSTVRVIRTTKGNEKTIHFWDEGGGEHHHNPNVIVTELECSNGHRFAERSSWECVTCSYKACEAEIVEPQEEQPATVEHVARRSQVRARRKR